MKVREIVDLMERYLPCPPSSEPEPGSDADYLWRATVVNTQYDPPLRIVEMQEYQPEWQVYDLTVEPRDVRILQVECDERGRGVRVLR